MGWDGRAAGGPPAGYAPPGPGMQPGYRGPPGPRPGYPGPMGGPMGGAGGFACVRLRGLPFGVTERDIVMFLVGGRQPGAAQRGGHGGGGARALSAGLQLGGWG